MQIAIIIVSTSCFVDRSQDKTAEKLKDWLFATGEHNVVSMLYAKDELTSIQNALGECAHKLENNGGLIVTSGGTGFSPDDVTPEAVESVITKRAYGLVHAMMAKALEYTPMAALSRPVAGFFENSVVVTLPGSPKGAVECLEAILPVLPHAVQLASGVNSRQLHAESNIVASSGNTVRHHEQAHGHSHPHSHGHSHSHSQSRDHSHSRSRGHSHSHSHGHSHSHSRSHSHTHSHGRSHAHAHGHSHHHGPKFYSSPASRYRESPYPMLPVHEALDIIFARIPAPEATTKYHEECSGHIISQNITSPINIPPYRTSIVDGYAVGDYKFPGEFPVSAISHAVHESNVSPELQSGSISRITTGARIPQGAIAVIPVENTLLTKKTDDGLEELEVRINIDEAVTDGDNIREVGSDVTQGETVLEKGQLVTSAGGEIGVAASIGLRTLPVYRRPVVGILSGGNELLEPGAQGTYPIYDSNRYSLMTMCLSHGYEVIDAGIAQDNVDSLTKHIKAALERVDVLVTTGGVSMGETDLIKPVIENEIGGTIHFGRVAMKPGKPMTFATAGDKSNKLIFSLPGNPASCIVTFHLFVLPALRRWAGYSLESSPLPRIMVTLRDSLNLDPRPEFHRAYTAIDDELGEYVVTSTGNQRSSRVRSMVGAQALLCLPARSDTIHQLPAGTKVSAILLP